ncbi:MAG: carboxymuconolactone decarboxylase family protein [Sphingomicrobium sp.]
MTDLSEKSELGLTVIGEMMSPQFADAMRGAATSGSFGATLARFGLEHSFADVWARDGMARKARSLVIIGALIAMRQPAELKNHVRIGLNNGLSVREIEEALITASPYVGLPCIALAATAVMEVLRERGLDATATAEEKGLL